MDRVRRRDLLAALAITPLAAGLALLPPLDRLHGWSIDVLTALRWRSFGNRYEPAASPTVVVAIDEQTYQSPPFKGSYTPLWLGEIGRVLTAVIDGGARVVGFDVVFETSIEASEIPIGQDTVGTRLRGFDREFLRDIAGIARADKLVLGQIQIDDQVHRPFDGLWAAAGRDQNARFLNTQPDPDEVTRRVPLRFILEASPAVPSFALELTNRSISGAFAAKVDQAGAIDRYRTGSIVSDAVTLNFEGGSQDIPTYSLADLRECRGRGNSEFFHHYFNNKVVILADVTRAQDQKLTSKRFATAPEEPSAARCAPAPAASTTFTPRAISGVYIHATAVNNLLRGDSLIETGSFQAGMIAAVFSAVPAIAALLLSPFAAVASFLTLAAAWSVTVLVAFQQTLVLPWLQSLFAGFTTLFVMIAVRSAETDWDRRLLRKSFALYLAPALIEKMLSSSKLPVLGGESRSVTLFFADVAGFSTLAETMPPAELVALMNAYLAAMTDVIEAHGGFVDKYIGDAIVAVFGAPLDDPDHATHAVRAALSCCERLSELNSTTPAFKDNQLAHRIGLNSGEALVGNVGSGRRFNYTAIGASRLEGANKYFATAILASEMTVSLTGNVFTWREVDTIRVIGRRQPIRIYEPLAPAGQETTSQTAHAKIYAEGLARWRKADFAAAAELFGIVANTDPPSSLFAQ
jgi:class 3 adenylate cyclase/CHASE2 domain-containing sensor protein